MSFGPTNYRQGGTRGGADQFKWDDVKNDKYRENYLGHSVQAPVGRWQKGKDLTWYTKLNREDRAAALRDEVVLAKQRDQELMDQALGIAPKKRAEPTGQLDATEMKELLKRGASDREGLDGERVEGLGAAPVPQDFDIKPKKTLAQKYEDDLKRGRTNDDIYALRGSASASTGEPRSEKEERAMKKALKKQKKKEKRAKKKEKKEKKRGRRAREDRHSDDEEKRGRSPERRDLGSLRRRRSVSSASSASSRSPSRSPPTTSSRRATADRRSRSRSPRRGGREYTSSRRRSSSRSRSRSHRRRRSRSKSPDYRRRHSPPPRSRGRSHSRDRSPPPRRR